MFSAHSPDKKRGIAAQSYESHITAVLRMAEDYACEAAEFAKKDKEFFLQIVRQAALFHDLGKLDKENQSILCGEKQAPRLPKNHVDAGAAYFFGKDNISSFAAAVIQAHHIGYCNFVKELGKEELIFRDPDIFDYTNNTLSELLQIHNSLIKETYNTGGDIAGQRGLFLRLVLSCLADADHTDTSVHYKNHEIPPPYIKLRPDERLAKLDDYVSSLKTTDDERSNLRKEMYHVCKNVNIKTDISSCDSPVGSGKTTAIMAHLLQIAQNRGLRRIFVVLPFTNIIRQSVKVYRNSLVLAGEDENDVVAELHHRADFQNPESRYLTSLWRAPIIVTTAVTFFETLASNNPATLRRLHELPGSAIFIDESHAALPPKLMPLAWQWINDYAAEWGCYWVLASGSLNRFWQIPEISQGKNIVVPEIVNNELRKKLSVYENNRVQYKHDMSPKKLKEFAEWIVNFPGPRIVVVNTVQNAAVIADYFEKNYDRNSVEHLSTALSPLDRTGIIKRIEERLENQNDVNWTLVATSCVEAGVDFSFRTGFRELSSLLSLIQLAGRVNRHGFYDNSEVWTFCLAENEGFNKNHELSIAQNVLKYYIENNVVISPELSTESIQREIREKGVSTAFKELLDSEKFNKFPIIEEKFKVINSDTRLVLVDTQIIEKIKRHEKITWQEIQNNSVSIYSNNIKRFSVEELIKGLYKWDLFYDDFLGVMRGILPILKAENGGDLII
jgi:CRISPR-associated endonuclease Cas3-HD